MKRIYNIPQKFPTNTQTEGPLCPVSLLPSTMRLFVQVQYVDPTPWLGISSGIWGSATFLFLWLRVRQCLAQLASLSQLCGGTEHARWLHVIHLGSLGVNLAILRGLSTKQLLAEVSNRSQPQPA